MHDDSVLCSVSLNAFRYISRKLVQVQLACRLFLESKAPKSTTTTTTSEAQAKSALLSTMVDEDVSKNSDGEVEYVIMMKTID